MDETSKSATIEDEAADWFARLNNGDALDVDWEKFDAWKASDPAHAVAYAEISLIWEDLGTLEVAPTSIEVTSRAYSSNPITLMADQAFASIASALRNPFGKIAAFSGGAAALFSVFWIGALYGGVFDQIYETEIGARTTIVAKDGSHIELNTNSRLRVAFRLRTRRVLLERGQAYFDVSKDESRPFSIRANNSTVTVAGTRFDVDISKTNKILVTVAEGLVTIALTDNKKENYPTTNAAEIVVSSGKRFEGNVSDNSHDLREANTDDLLAWRKSRLIFHDTRFDDAIAELSRYMPMRLSIHDQILAEKTFSGVIQLDDPDAIILSLEAISGAQSVRSGDNEVIFQPRLN